MVVNNFELRGNEAPKILRITGERALTTVNYTRYGDPRLPDTQYAAENEGRASQNTKNFCRGYSALAERVGPARFITS
jgi:hypothetical protein